VSVIAALHLVTVRSCCSGVRRGTSFPGWVVQAEVPFDKSFGYNGPRPITVKRMISHPAWVVCDAALFDLATQRWLEAWERATPGRGAPQGQGQPTGMSPHESASRWETGVRARHRRRYGWTGALALALAGAIAAVVLAVAPASATKPRGITPKIAACERAGNFNCNPNPGSVERFPLAKPDPPGARLITRRQVLTRFGDLGHLKRGETVVAVRTTYGQIQAAHPTLAAASPNVVDPTRIVWVMTWHFAKPVAYQPCRYGYCPPTASDRTVWIAAWSMVIDAASGQMTDSCDGCAALPLATPRRVTAPRVSRAQVR
jgi:hypothetical protein